MSEKRTCCYVHPASARSFCFAEATWEILDPGKHPADGTVDACEDHGWALIPQGEVIHINQIEGILSFELRSVPR